MSENWFGMASSDDEASPSAEKGPFGGGNFSSWQVDDESDGETLALFPEGDQPSGVGRGGPKRDLAEEIDKQEAEEMARYYEEWQRKHGDGQPPPYVRSTSESDDDGDGGGSDSPSLLDKG